MSTSLLRALPLAAFAIAACALSSGAEPGRQVSLPTRSMTVGRGVPSDLQAKLHGRRFALPAVVVLGSPTPSPEVRARLNDAGLQLMQALSPDAYLALIASDAKLSELQTMVVGMAPLAPADHVAPDLWKGSAPAWARVDGAYKVVVRFYPGVSQQDAASVMQRWTREARPHGPSGEWAGVLDAANVPRLAAEEGVEWIEPGPDPSMPLGD